MKKPGVVGAFVMIILLAGFLFFRGRSFQKGASRGIPPAGETLQIDPGGPEVISGRITSIDVKDQVFMLDHGLKALPFHLGKDTAITIANHPVTSSALVPGAFVTVQCLSKNDQVFARSIQILPVRK